jgi:uncharacterized protein (TIGR00251 family)
MNTFRESDGAVTFAVKVVPRASKNQIVGLEGDAVKIRLNAPPVEGKANAVLIKFLADLLQVRRAQIEILTGHSGRHKVVRVLGADTRRVKESIVNIVPPSSV